MFTWTAVNLIHPPNSRVQSRRFTVDSAQASALDSGTNFWVMQLYSVLRLLAKR
jgi:hypothetical protein